PLGLMKTSRGRPPSQREATALFCNAACSKLHFISCQECVSREKKRRLSPQLPVRSHLRECRAFRFHFTARLRETKPQPACSRIEHRCTRRTVDAWGHRIGQGLSGLPPSS